MAKGSMERIRKRFGISIYKGSRVGYRTNPYLDYQYGTVVGASQYYVHIRFDGKKRIFLCHPEFHIKVINEDK